jgi:ribosomal protein S3
MGQKIRPTGFRTGIMIGWQSQWCANPLVPGNHFSDLLVEDHKIRKFISKLLKKKRPQIAKITIERTREKVIVTITSAKIGVIIGKKGADIDKLTQLLQQLTRRVIEVKTVEVGRPETDPQIIAEEIAEQLEKRASFRRTMKQAMEKCMEAGGKRMRTGAMRRGFRFVEVQPTSLTTHSGLGAGQSSPAISNRARGRRKSTGGDGESASGAGDCEGVGSDRVDGQPSATGTCWGVFG